MQKNIIISLVLFMLWSCAGSNATSMEYRSATTAVRSERNFAKGEEYALKALDLEIHQSEARVAYFLAVEIYRPRKDWVRMNEMLDLAMEKNPGENLERPMRLDNGKVLKTISDAVPVYKDEIWMNAFNKTVSLVDAQKFNEALEEINFAKSILEKSDNYLTSTLINLQLAQDSGDSNKKYEKAAKDNLNKALELDSNNYRALQIYGDLEFQVQNFELAREYYQKALSNTKNADNISELKQSLIYIHVELEEYDKAIILSDEVLESNPDNADIYFNVGVIYQRLGNTFYENMVSKYKSLTSSDKMTNEGIKNIYEDCKETLKMVNLAKDYFMDASMLEIDDNNVGQTESAINDMKRLRKNIKDVYLLSIEKIANDNNVILD
jgi:tetratricopeptide (TPR) repeat protein